MSPNMGLQAGLIVDTFTAQPGLIAVESRGFPITIYDHKITIFVIDSLSPARYDDLINFSRRIAYD
jgi:hypothetical protein